MTDPPTDRDQREVLQNDQQVRAGTTYFDHARNLANETGGRWAMGRTDNPTTKVPHQPPGSPWASDPVPNEEPLGFFIDQMEPTGTPAEVAASERLHEIGANVGDAPVDAALLYPNHTDEQTRQQMQTAGAQIGARAPQPARLLSHAERGSCSPLGGKAR